MRERQRANLSTARLTHRDPKSFGRGSGRRPRPHGRRSCIELCSCRALPRLARETARKSIRLAPWGSCRLLHLFLLATRKDATGMASEECTLRVAKLTNANEPKAKKPFPLRHSVTGNLQGSPFIRKACPWTTRSRSGVRPARGCFAKEPTVSVMDSRSIATTATSSLLFRRKRKIPSFGER